jgi:hypothetical protein
MPNPAPLPPLDLLARHLEVVPVETLGEDSGLVWHEPTASMHKPKLRLRNGVMPSLMEDGLMAELSPPAKAILAAAFAVEDEWDTIPMIAAALHAAADQLLAVQWNGQIPADTAHQIGINWARDALHVLANELEAQ